MKVKLILSYLFSLVCIIATACFLMGMVSREESEKPLAQQFTEIRNNLPKSGPNIAQLQSPLNAVQLMLQQAQPNYSSTINVLQAMKQGPLKNVNFNTDFGTVSGEQLISIYFDDFIKKLETKTQPSSKPAAPIAQLEEKTSGVKNWAQQFAEILQNLPQTGQNIPILRNELNKVHTILNQPQPKLADALKVLQQIKLSDIKNLQFNTPLLGAASGTQLMSVYFDEFIKMMEFEIQKNKPHVPGKPYGLVNRNNACFMNASIQSLVSLEKLTNVLLKHAFDDFYKPDSISALYIKLLNTMQTERISVIDPLPFCLQGWKLMPGSQIGEQQDAPEFVQFLLEALAEKDINRSRTPSGINKDVTSLLEIKMSERSYDEKGGLLLRKDSDHLVLPPVAIEPTNKTLLNCLQGLFTIEMHPAQETQRKVTALLSTSNYFLIRLRRTQWNQETGTPFKNEQAISFELDNFDISPLSLTSKKFPLYRCKAFVLHVGTPAVGHYIAYIRMQNNWFICDDTHVTPVEVSEVRKFAEQGVSDSEYGAKLTPVMFFYEQQ